MTGKEMMAREEQLLADLIAERDSLRKQVKALTKQRTWVGLTQDEFREFATTYEYGTGGLIRAIEAKLKELNK